VIGELPKKKRKKKKKSASKPKQQSVFDENLLRNYISVNKQELNRLKGDLTAYRQEAQTAFKQNVAFPRATVQFGDLPTSAPTTEIDVSELENVLKETEPSISGTDIGPDDISSLGEEELMEEAGPGAGRLTEPEGMTTDTEVTMAKLRQRLKEKQFSQTAELPPRPSRRGRKRSTQKNMAELKRELRAESVYYPSNIKKDALHALAPYMLLLKKLV
jgi:hypothetical protein